MSTRAKTIFLTALSILMFSFVSKGQDTVNDIFRQSFLRAEAAYRNQPYEIPSVAIPKMIPPFNNDSDKMAYTREHRPEHHVFSLGKDANIIRLHDNLNILSKIIDEGAKYSVR